MMCNWVNVPSCVADNFGRSLFCFLTLTKGVSLPDLVLLFNAAAIACGRGRHQTGVFKDARSRYEAVTCYVIPAYNSEMPINQ